MKRAKDGHTHTKTYRMVCTRSAVCEVCGHCAGCCPGHTMLRGEPNALLAHDTRITKPSPSEVKATGTVTVMAG